MKKYQLLQYVSYVVTFVVYAYLLNWQAALLIMFGISVHELGHLWAAQRLGKSTKGFYLIPFFGGLAVATEPPNSYKETFFFYIMGPVVGSVVGFITVLAWYITGNALLGSAAFWMLFINLFNLLPFSFLDGGQILRTFTFSFSEKVGVYSGAIFGVIGALLLFKFNVVIAILMGLYTAHESYMEITSYRAKLKKEYWLVNPRYKASLLPRLSRGVLMGNFGYCALLIVSLVIGIIFLQTSGVQIYLLFNK